VQRMLQLNHSQIRLVEHTGTGATFCFELPVSGVSQAAGAAGPSQSSSWMTGQRQR
jgi:hypothetical protein